MEIKTGQRVKIQPRAGAALITATVFRITTGRSGVTYVSVKTDAGATYVRDARNIYPA